MRVYIHKENVLLLLGTAGFGALSAWVMKVEGTDWIYIVGVGLFFAFISGLFVFRMWKFRHDEEIEDNVYKRVKLEVREHELVFPRGYYFRQSTIYKTRRIPANIISAINAEQWPPSCIINDNEIIFLKYEQKDELMDFANRNGIPLTDQPDLWSYICEPFLDTEVTE